VCFLSLLVGKGTWVLRAGARRPRAGIALDRVQHWNRVRRAVLALPEHQRTVVAMHHLEGKPVDEIAREMSMPKGTVVSRLARGRKALRRRLARFVEEQEG